MGQVSVTLNGRTYRLRCGDGEEERLLTVVAHVRGHVETLIAEHGQIGDDRLLLMAGIMITDELFELRDQQRSSAGPGTSAGSGSVTSASGTTIPAPPASSRPWLPPSAAPAASPTATLAGSAPNPAPAVLAVPPSVAMPAPVHRESVLPSPPGGIAQARVTMPVPAPAGAPAQPQPVAPVPAPPAAAGAPPRSLEHLDATALMKGIERKTGRS